MYLLRPSQKSDLDSLVEFAFRSQRGLTSLPRNPETLEKKISCSERSFQKKIESPGEEYYLFVLEEVEEKKVIGCSALYSLTGWDEPIYYFHIRDGRFLDPVHYDKLGSKLCSLFLLREHREKGLGKLLSKARFHFLKDHEKRFTNDIYAEMRGAIRPPNYCPFWEAIGKKILSISFEEFENELDRGHAILSRLMIKEPIDILTLPQEAQKAIGETNDHTKGALALLEREGFRFSQEISIDDGGPRVIAKTESLTTIRESRKIAVDQFTPSSTEPYLITNCRLDFRAIIGQFEDNRSLSDREKALLEIGRGENIRVSAL